MNLGTGVSLSSGTLLTQLQLEVELHDYPDVSVLWLEPGTSPQLNLTGAQLVVGCMCFLGAIDLTYGQSSNFGSSNYEP
jgi:hypothetical protein